MFLIIFKLIWVNDIVMFNFEKKNFEVKYLCWDYVLKYIGIIVMYIKKIILSFLFIDLK